MLGGPKQLPPWHLECWGSRSDAALPDQWRAAVRSRRSRVFVIDMLAVLIVRRWNGIRPIGSTLAALCGALMDWTAGGNQSQTAPSRRYLMRAVEVSRKIDAIPGRHGSAYLSIVPQISWVNRGQTGRLRGGGCEGRGVSGSALHSRRSSSRASPSSDQPSFSLKHRSLLLLSR